MVRCVSSAATRALLRFTSKRAPRTPTARSRALIFTNDGGSIPEKSPFYYHDTGTCPSVDDEYVGCSVARPLTHATWFLLTAAILLLLGLGAFRRFR